MKRYRLKITLADGRIVDAKSVGEDHEQAIERICSTEQFIKFVGEREIVNVECELLGEVGKIVDKENFVLQRSKERDGWWVATDTATNIVLQFEQGNFKHTATITPIADLAGYSELSIATALRELGEWLATYHGDLIKEAQGPGNNKHTHRQTIGKMIADARKEKGWSVRNLASRAGITVANLCNIENGRYSTGVDVLTRLADALGMEWQLHKIIK